MKTFHPAYKNITVNRDGNPIEDQIEKAVGDESIDDTDKGAEVVCLFKYI